MITSTARVTVRTDRSAVRHNAAELCVDCAHAMPGHRLDFMVGVLAYSSRSATPRVPSQSNARSVAMCAPASCGVGGMIR